MSHTKNAKSGNFFINDVSGKVDFVRAAGAFGLLLTLASTQCGLAQANIAPNTLPTGATSVQGNVSFNKVGNTLNVNTAANQSIANYQTFNVGSDARVNFNLPNSGSAILNRVAGNTNSQIFGQINSNGNVFLVNPNGILFGETAQVNVNSMISSTLNIDDDDFMNGNYAFYQDGAPASVVNCGNITTTGGVAAFLGGAFHNHGTVSSPNGSIQMAVGEKLTLDLGDGVNAEVTIDESLKSKVDGLTDAILNTGILSADGGNIDARVQVADSFYDKMINNTGLIRANGLVDRHGEITLVAFSDDCTDECGGVVANSGTIEAIRNVTQDNGTVVAEMDGLVQLLGDKLVLTDGSITGEDVTLFSKNSFDIGSSILANDLRIRTLGGITQTARIHSRNTSIRAVGSVDLTHPQNDFLNFSALIAGDGSSLSINENSNISITDFDGIRGIYTNNGDVNIVAGQDINLYEGIYAGKGDVTLTAGDDIEQKREYAIVSAKKLDMTAGDKIKGYYTGMVDGNKENFFLTSVNKVTSNVDFNNLDYDKLIKGQVDLGGETITQVIDTITTTTHGGLQQSDVNVTPDQAISFLEQLIIADIEAGATSGTGGGSAIDLNNPVHQTFIALIQLDPDTFIELLGEGNAAQNGTFQHTFTYNGQEVVVTGHADQLQNAIQNVTTEKIYGEVYKDYTEIAINKIGNKIENRSSQLASDGVGWGDMTCEEFKESSLVKAAQIEDSFRRGSPTPQESQNQNQGNDQNVAGNYGYEWEILNNQTPVETPVETPVTVVPEEVDTSVVPPIIADNPTIPVETPVIVVPEEGTTNVTTPFVAGTPVTTGNPTFVNAPVTIIPGVIPTTQIITASTFAPTTTPAGMVVATPLLANGTPVSGPTLANAVVSTPGLGEAGPVVATPVAYLPEEETPATPAEDAPSVSEPVFYYPALW